MAARAWSRRCLAVAWSIVPRALTISRLMPPVAPIARPTSAQRASETPKRTHHIFPRLRSDPAMVPTVLRAGQGVAGSLQRAATSGTSHRLPTRYLARSFHELVSAAGFEPTAPGFIPLRLSPPPARTESGGRSWSGLSLHHRLQLFLFLGRHPLSTPSRPSQAGLGSGSARRERVRAFPDFERIRHAVSPRGAQLVTRNPVLYPAELRGQPG